MLFGSLASSSAWIPASMASLMSSRSQSRRRSKSARSRHTSSSAGLVCCVWFTVRAPWGLCPGCGWCLVPQPGPPLDHSLASGSISPCGYELAVGGGSLRGARPRHTPKKAGPPLPRFQFSHPEHPPRQCNQVSWAVVPLPSNYVLGS